MLFKWVQTQIPTDIRNLTFVFYDSAEICNQGWAPMKLGRTECLGF